MIADLWEERRSGWKKYPDDSRTNFDIDFSRVVHSGSFRRLQGKTQILNLGDSDFYRTRLTHSLEVAQIATGILLRLRDLYSHEPVYPHLPEFGLMQTLGYSHDLGHPPFGHGGEIALNYCMRNAGGFEGNGQTLRILSRLERFSDHNGADFTRRALLGVLKYPAAFSAVFNPELAPCLQEGTQVTRIIDREKSIPPKCYLDSEKEVVDWIFTPFTPEDTERFVDFQRRPEEHAKTREKSFDCSIMDVADDIAYGVHDLEDAIALGLIDEKAFRNRITDEVCARYLDALKQKYPNESANNVYERLVTQLFGGGDSRKHAISRLVYFFISNVLVESKDVFTDPLLRFRAAMHPDVAGLLSALKSMVYDLVIKSANVQHLEFKGQTMVVAVFEVIASEPKAFLPSDAFHAYIEGGRDLRIICDHIAGMTDAFLMKTYERLFSPRMGSVFDRL
ncbi:anti-phage deoxyguanosine triphosphatase [Ensifer sp. ENS03]|uniref:anti-phage deoxyguanosine triphosphatase n=1 Tax=Ensifer sp. ENS03 TaxID=2769283 RepID=UPI0035301B9C